MVEFAGSNSGIAHSPGSLAMRVRTVAAPDHEIRIEVVDRESGAPLKGINLIMGPYRATTGGDGVAQMRVVGDHYVLHASGLQRMPYRDHLDATRPIGLRLLMAVELPQEHFMPPVDPETIHRTGAEMSGMRGHLRLCMLALAACVGLGVPVLAQDNSDLAAGQRRLEPGRVLQLSR